jgi:N-acetylneuraminic acid mutarotase
LKKCEKFSLVENVWRPIASMNLSRNGTAAVILEQYRLIFVFGGNNHKHGSLTKIEKYEIDFDKWSMIDIHLKTAIHDLSALCVVKERVLIFGGHTNTEPNKEI